MIDEQVSSLFVPMRGGTGIVTDRELRASAASRRSQDLPVEQIASFPARTLASSTAASDALIEMFTTNARHFPVTGADGEVVRVITDTDLIGVGRHTPFALRSSIQGRRALKRPSPRHAPCQLQFWNSCRPEPNRFRGSRGTLASCLAPDEVDVAGDVCGLHPLHQSIRTRCRSQMVRGPLGQRA
jgi:hypothetical protein